MCTLSPSLLLEEKLSLHSAGLVHFQFHFRKQEVWKLPLSLDTVFSLDGGGTLFWVDKLQSFAQGETISTSNVSSACHITHHGVQCSRMRWHRSKSCNQFCSDTGHTEGS